MIWLYPLPILWREGIAILVHPAAEYRDTEVNKGVRLSYRNLRT